MARSAASLPGRSHHLHTAKALWSDPLALALFNMSAILGLRRLPLSLPESSLENGKITVKSMKIFTHLHHLPGPALDSPPASQKAA